MNINIDRAAAAEVVTAIEARLHILDAVIDSKQSALSRGNSARQMALVHAQLQKAMQKRDRLNVAHAMFAEVLDL